MSGYRLALVTDSTEVGGAEVFLGNLVAELPDDVTAVVMAVDPYVLDRVTSARAGCEGVLLGPGVRLALRALREHRPDVVHLNLTAFPTCREPLIAAFMLRLPVVLVDHLPTAGLSWKGRVVQRVMTSHAAARIAVGRSSARLVEEHGGLRAGSVASIPNGVRVVADPPPLPDTDGCTVGIMGRLEDQKGIDVALRALALVPNLRLLVMGSGSRRDSLEQLTDELMLRSRVRFVDGSPDVAPFWRQVDLLCMPSRAEGLPLALLEAMHRGRPVVATAVGSVPDVVTPDVGVLVAPNDPVELAVALRRLAGDPVLRRSLGVAALERARSEWSAERMARQYDEVYRAAVRR